MTTKKTACAALVALTCAALTFVSPLPVQAQTQAQMNAQAAREAAKADVAMNAAYKKLMGVLNAAQEAHLRQAQRAWLVYRNHEAALSASVGEGGTMYPTLYSSTIEELTEKRTQELRRDYGALKP